MNDFNTISTPWGMQGEVNPDVAIELQNLERKRMIANALMQQGMQQPQGKMVGRFYVPPSPLQHLANLAHIATSSYMMHDLDQQRHGLMAKDRQQMQQALAQYRTLNQPQTVNVEQQGPGAPMPKFSMDELGEMNQMQKPGTAVPMFDDKTLAEYAGLKAEGPRPTTPLSLPPDPAQLNAFLAEQMANQNPRVAQWAGSMLNMQQAQAEREAQREFTRQEKALDRENRLLESRTKMDLLVAMGLMKQDQADKVMKNAERAQRETERHNKVVESLEGQKLNAKQATLTPGELAVDKDYAKDYVEFTTGGYADAQKGLKQLQDVVKEVEKGGLTGPMIGNTPDMVRQFSNPQSLAVRDRVEEVVQRNLRVILGPQFTEKEGKQLIARAYNEKLSGQENADRLTRLITQMESALKSKSEAAKYFQSHGTLKGWKGKTTWNISDFDPSNSQAEMPTSRSLTNAKGWTLQEDAKGNKAYVSPDGTEFEEVR